MALQLVVALQGKIIMLIIIIIEIVIIMVQWWLLYSVALHLPIFSQTMHQKLCNILYATHYTILNTSLDK